MPFEDRPVRKMVRGLQATKHSGEVWIVRDLSGSERGRFRGQMPMFPKGVGFVSMRVYDDDVAECGFLAEGILEVFDELPGLRMKPGDLRCGDCKEVVGQWDSRVYFGEPRGHLCERCARRAGWQAEDCLPVWDERKGIRCS